MGTGGHGIVFSVSLNEWAENKPGVTELSLGTQLAAWRSDHFYLSRFSLVLLVTAFNKFKFMSGFLFFRKLFVLVYTLIKISF